MSSDDLEYYSSRAQRERECADAADDPRAAAIHETLADVYEALVANNQRPSARILRPDFQKRWVNCRERAASGDQIKRGI
jgi:hypothetical protein